MARHQDDVYIPLRRERPGDRGTPNWRMTLYDVARGNRHVGWSYQVLFPFPLEGDKIPAPGTGLLKRNCFGLVLSIRDAGDLVSQVVHTLGTRFRLDDDDIWKLTKAEDLSAGMEAIGERDDATIAARASMIDRGEYLVKLSYVKALEGALRGMGNGVVKTPLGTSRWRSLLEPGLTDNGPMSFRYV